MADARVQLVIEIDDNGTPKIRSLVGNLEQLHRAAGRAGGGFSKLQADVVATNQGMELAAKVVRTLSSAFNETLNRVVAQGEAFERMSRRLSIPVEILSKFDFAARQAGVSLETMGQGFKGLAKSLVEAEESGSRANKILVNMGFSLQQIKELQRDPVKAVLALADAFNKYEDGARKTTAAQILFQRGAEDMLVLFKETSAGLQKNLDLSERLGTNWSTTQVAAAKRLGSAWSEAREALDGIGKSLLGNEDLLHRLADITDTVRERTIAWRESLTPDQIQAMADGVVGLTKVFLALSDALLTIGSRAATAAGSIARMLEQEMKVRKVGVENQELRARLDRKRAGIASPAGRLASSLLGGGGFSSAPVAPDFSSFLSRAAPDQIQSLLAGKPPPGATKQGFPDIPKAGGGGDADAFAKKVAELKRRIDELKGSLTPTQSAVEDIVASFGKGGAAVRGLAEEYVHLQESQDRALDDIAREMARIKEPTVEAVQQLGALAEKAEKIGKNKAVAEVLKDLAKQAANFSDEMGKAGRALEENLTERLEDVIDPAGKAGREFDKMRQKADSLGRADLKPLIDQLEAVEQAAAVLDSVFGELQRGVSDVFEGLILGTSKVEDAFKQMAIAIVRSISEMLISSAFAQLRTGLLQSVASGGGQGGGGGFSFTGLLSSLLGGGGGGGGVLGGLGGGASSSIVQVPSYTAGGLQIPNTFGAGSLASGGYQSLAGTGGASLSSVVTGIAGLVIALAAAGKGIADDRKTFNRVTLDTAQRQNNLLTGLQSTLTVTGAVGGAIAGAAVGSVVPVLGNIVGALLGAAIGTALGQGIGSGIQGGVTKGTSTGLKAGITQPQLVDTVADNLAGRGVGGPYQAPGSALQGLLMALEHALDLITLGMSALARELGVGVSDTIAGLFTPSIEEIYAKMFRQVLGKGGLNTQGIVTSGPVSPEAKELRSVARDFSIILAEISGIGGATGNRLNRFTALFAGGAAQQAAKTGEDPEIVMYRIFRRIFNVDFVTALKAAQNIPGIRTGTGDPRLRNRIVDAFEAGLPEGTDLDPLVDVVTTQGRGFGGRRNRRKSREAVAEALPALFEDDGLQNFTRSLTGAFRKAFADGVTGAIVSGTFGNILAGVFGLERRTRRAIKRNDFEQAIPLIEEDVRRSIQEFSVFLKAGTPLFKSLAELANIQKLAEVTFALATGDKDAARAAVLNAIGPIVQIAEGFTQLRESVAARAAAGAGGNGLAGQRAQVGVLGRQAMTARERLLTTAGVDSMGQLGDSEYLKENLGQALELLGQYADAQLTFLENSLSLARQTKDYWESVRLSFNAVGNAVTSFRGGRFGRRAVLDEDLAEARSLQSKAFGGDEDAIARLSQLLPQIFQTATQNFNPGSPKLGSILDFIEGIASKLELDATEERDKAAEEVTKLTKDFKVFSTTVVPILERFETIAKNDLAAKFTEVVTALGTQGDLYKILVAIGTELGVDTSKLQPNQGPGGERFAGSGGVTGGQFTGRALFTDKGLALDFGVTGSDVTSRTSLQSGAWVQLQKQPPYWGMLDLASDSVMIWRGPNPPGNSGPDNKPGQKGMMEMPIPIGAPEAGFAGGGSMVGGGMFMVGENGPEVMMARGGSPARIMPMASFLDVQRGMPVPTEVRGGDGSMAQVAVLLGQLLQRGDQWRASQEQMAHDAIRTLRDEGGSGGGDVHLHVDGGGSANQPIAAIARQLAQGLGSGGLSELRYELQRLVRSAR